MVSLKTLSGVGTRYNVARGKVHCLSLLKQYLCLCKAKGVVAIMKKSAFLFPAVSHI